MVPRKNSASLILLLGLLASPALAQQEGHTEHHPSAAPAPEAAMPSQAMPGGSSMMGMMRMMMGQDGMGGMAMMAAMAGHVEGRLAFLKTELKITDAQLPLWNTFAEAARDNAKAMEQMMQGGMMGTSRSASLPEKLVMREKMMSAHLEALRKLRAAIDPLYTAFSDEQKKTADEIMLTPMGMM